MQTINKRYILTGCLLLLVVLLTTTVGRAQVLVTLTKDVQQLHEGFTDEKIVMAAIIAAVIILLLMVFSVVFWLRWRQQKQYVRILLAQLKKENMANKAATAGNEEAETAEEQAPTKGSQISTDELMPLVNEIIYRLMPLQQADIEHVASELCLSPSQFRRKIQGVTGQTPANYILTVRLDEAKRLLAQYPKYTIADVAERCGFADNAHFTHAFKRMFGINPSQFVAK